MVRVEDVLIVGPVHEDDVDAKGEHSEEDRRREGCGCVLRSLRTRRACRPSRCGFNGRTRLDTIGHPHSAQLHVIERYTRRDLGHIDYEITIDDPVTYTKPWKNVRVFTLRPDWEIMEYSCEENNKDFFEGHIKATADPNQGAPAK